MRLILKVLLGAPARHEGVFCSDHANYGDNQCDYSQNEDGAAPYYRAAPITCYSTLGLGTPTHHEGAARSDHGDDGDNQCDYR